MPKKTKEQVLAYVIISKDHTNTIHKRAQISILATVNMKPIHSQEPNAQVMTIKLS